MSEVTQWKPASYSSVSPYLVVRGAERVIEFAKTVFGASELRRVRKRDGTIEHAELKIDDSVVMLGDGGEQFPPIPSLVHVFVPDVDRAYARALEAGATSVEEPSVREGQSAKRGTVKDPCGNTWSISTQLKG